MLTQCYMGTLGQAAHLGQALQLLKSAVIKRILPNRSRPQALSGKRAKRTAGLQEQTEQRCNHSQPGLPCERMAYCYHLNCGRQLLE